MTPIFDVDFKKVDASFPMYTGRFQIQVAAREAFHRESKADSDGNVKTTAGVKFKLEMVGQYDDDGELQMDGLKGKPISPYTVWLHSEGGLQFAKPFIMACSGYRRNQDAEANEKLFQTFNWNIEGELNDPPESFTLDNGWEEQVGQLVDVTMSIRRRPNEANPDEPFENQEFSGWTPVAA